MSSPAEGGRDAFRLLFVCTGNTCRSPLAEALARAIARERGWKNLEVRSAGVAAAPGGPASRGAVRAARRHGLDLTGHESRGLDLDLVEWADLILVMSPHHALLVEELGGGRKVSTLRAFATEGRDRGPVADPVGGDDQVYERTFRELEELLDRALSRVEPMLEP